jgi:hypothetical protein
VAATKSSHFRRPALMQCKAKLQRRPVPDKLRKYSVFTFERDRGRMANDPLMYEFIIPSEIMFADSVDWQPLVAARDGIDMALHKPFSGEKVVTLDRTYSKQVTQIGYSIVHVVLVADDKGTPDWGIPFKLVNDFLQWIRVRGLQYWVGSMPTMRKDIARGTIIFNEQRTMAFAGSVCPLHIEPLTRETWEWIGVQLAKNRKPNVPDLLMSDALNSFTGQDFLQTIIRLGVICELALNAFIEDLLTLHPPIVRALYDERKPFKEKLKSIPGILGADNYHEHKSLEFKELITLYQLRGAAIHHATLETDGKPVDEGTVIHFISATLDFLNWTQDQRVKLRIAI